MIIKKVKEVKQLSDTLTTAINTAFTAVKTDVASLFEKALPAGLAIMGISLAITLGVKFFKKIASK